MDCDVVVIGAGPAGAMAAGILARAGARVLLCERGAFPRHRLCGEFVSGEAAADLEALGLDLASTPAVRLGIGVVGAGERVATARFDPPAWSMSRRYLDAWIAGAAVALGATLRQRTRVTAVRGDAAHGFEVVLEGARAERLRARAVIGATGKSDRLFGSQKGRGWVALKLHLCGGASLPERVELHAIPGGYVGFAPVEEGRINVCLLVRPDGLRGLARQDGVEGAVRALVATVPEVEGLFAGRHVDATSLRGASGLKFAVARPCAGSVLLAGDVAGMPYPLVGDGIAMALRAGRMAATQALRCLEGELPPHALAGTYTDAWRREFAARLRWSARVNRLLESPGLARLTLGILRSCPGSLEFLVKRTRGPTVPPPFRP